MKKYLILLFMLVVLSGCKLNFTNKVTCTKEDKNNADYKLKEKIVVSFKNKKINYVDIDYNYEYASESIAKEKYYWIEYSVNSFNKSGFEAKSELDENIVKMHVEGELPKDTDLFSFTTSNTKKEYREIQTSSGYTCD